MGVIPKHAQIQVMDALTSCYLKHALNDDSIGWEELCDKMSCALQEVMGDDGFCFWLDSIKQNPGDLDGNRGSE